VITGPSGVGKGTLLARVRQHLDGVAFPVSATTRKPRPGEIHGVHYYFLSEEEFVARRERGEFVEWARYGNHLYGTLVDEIQRPLEQGLSVVLEIELKGSRQIRARFPEARGIFIAPPDREELARRLAKRGTESEQAVARRLEHAEEEMAASGEFDCVIVNDDLERAAEELRQALEEALSLREGVRQAL
jgi:guanylate kinase